MKKEHVTHSLPKIDLDLCIGCGACVEVCPRGVLQLVNRKSQVVRPEACIQVAACEAICPVGAISQVREKRFFLIQELSPIEVMEVALKLEKRIHDFYAKCVEKVTDPAKKQNFTHLSKLKETSMDLLKKEIKAWERKREEYP